MKVSQSVAWVLCVSIPWVCASRRQGPESSAACARAARALTVCCGQSTRMRSGGWASASASWTWTTPARSPSTSSCRCRSCSRTRWCSASSTYSTRTGTGRWGLFFIRLEGPGPSTCEASLGARISCLNLEWRYLNATQMLCSLRFLIALELKLSLNC